MENIVKGRSPATVPALPSSGPAAVRRLAADEAARALSWNQHMMRLLRRGAALREERELLRATEDDALGRRQSAAIMALIQAHHRPRVKHHVLRPTRVHVSTSPEVLE